MLTSQRLVERSLRIHGDRVALIDERGSVTYSALRQRSIRLANALHGLGAGADRPVSVLLTNESRFVEVDCACMLAGITRVGIGSRLSADECQYIAEHSQSSVLVTTPQLYQRFDPAKLPELRTVLLVDAQGNIPGGGRERAYEDVLRQGAETADFPAVGPDHPAYILYTSGTTGRPKGATHTHGARVAALVNMLASEIRADCDSAMVHCAPLTHGSGSKLLTFLALGARNVILPGFDPVKFADAVARYGGTHSFMVPTMLLMLLEAGETVRAAIRKMRQISFGGAPITDAVFRRSIEGFGPILTQVYGSCEAPHPVTVMQPEDYMSRKDPSEMAQSAGRASFGSDISITDDAGNILKAGEEGELRVRGPHLMNRYWRNENATAEAFAPGGWYLTGDVAMIDEAGFVYFRDRKRDLIITGGLNVYPSEVERVLAEHPNVKEVAVVAAPDDRWGEAVVACVVPREDGRSSEEDLIGWVGQHLAGYKKPRRVVFMKDLPKGSSNKVLKRELKAQFWEGRGRRVN